MYTLRVVRDTTFKRLAVQASTLPESEKIAVKSGTTYSIAAYIINDVSDHLKFTFAGGATLKGFNTFYAFGPDIQVQDASKKGAIVYPSINREIKLGVPFYPQTDNIFEPMRTCNTSSCAMCAKFLGSSISGDDEYYKVLQKHGDTTDHSAQTKALADIGIKSWWCTNLDYADLDRSLEAAKPVVIGIYHRGTISAPRGGHMVVVSGKVTDGYVVRDPFGSLMDSSGAYTGSVYNGNGAVYPKYELDARWLADGPKTGWGRLFIPPNH